MERSGLGIEIGGVKIPALVFADDIVLCGGSEIELSHLLGIIWQELDKLGLEINEAKSMTDGDNRVGRLQVPRSDGLQFGSGADIRGDDGRGDDR